MVFKQNKCQTSQLILEKTIQAFERKSPQENLKTRNCARGEMVYGADDLRLLS